VLPWSNGRCAATEAGSVCGQPHAPPRETRTHCYCYGSVIWTGAPDRPGRSRPVDGSPHQEFSRLLDRPAAESHGGGPKMNWTMDIESAYAGLPAGCTTSSRSGRPIDRMTPSMIAEANSSVWLFNRVGGQPHRTALETAFDGDRRIDQNEMMGEPWPRLVRPIVLSSGCRPGS